jgi:hypothetical protein
MTSDEVLQVLRHHYEGLFPKNCPNCGRRFESLREYILGTKPRGSAQSFDAELGDWDTQQPIGSIAYADCQCGNTLALGTESMPMPQRLALLAWVREQCENRQVTPTVVLEEIRAALREKSGPTK